MALGDRQPPVITATRMTAIIAQSAVLKRNLRGAL